MSRCDRPDCDQPATGRAIITGPVPQHRIVLDQRLCAHHLTGERAAQPLYTASHGWTLALFPLTPEPTR